MIPFYYIHYIVDLQFHNTFTMPFCKLKEKRKKQESNKRNTDSIYTFLLDDYGGINVLNGHYIISLHFGVINDTVIADRDID